MSKEYVEFEVTEADDQEKKVCYQAFLRLFGEKTVEMMRQMVAVEGAEIAFGRFMSNVPDVEQHIKDEKFKSAMNMYYNALLHIASNLNS